MITHINTYALGLTLVEAIVMADMTGSPLSSNKKSPTFTSQKQF